MGQASFVVTGGVQGVGLAIVRRLAQTGYVVVLDLHGSSDSTGLDSTVVHGDAGDPEVAAEAARHAEQQAPLMGWVNNAATFRDADLTSVPASEISDAVMANLRLAVTGCHTAVNHFVSRERHGAIVNVSSHQAQRPVRGALPYATAKAAIEGLTKAVAVDHGPTGIHTNAVALGSISTARWEAHRGTHPEADTQMAALHALGRVGTSEEVADVVHFLLSPAAGFVNGAILPVDGGRAVLGADPEAVPRAPPTTPRTPSLRCARPVDADTAAHCDSPR